MHISTLKNIRRNLPIALLLSLYLLSSVQTQFVSISATTNVLYIEPIADSFIDSKDMIGDSRVNLNYGGQEKLEVYYWHTFAIITEKRFTYLLFNLSAFPSQLQISSAELKLFTMDVTATLNIAVHYSSDYSWTETDITWNNKPQWKEESTDSKIVASTNQWITWDIKNDVINTLQTSEKFLTEVLIPDETGDLDATVRFYSKEASTSHPQIEITYEKIQTQLNVDPPGNREVGETIRFEGSIDPVWEGIAVILTLTDHTGESIQLSPIKTDSQGKFYIDYTVNNKGFWKVKATSESNPFFESAISSEHSFPVGVPIWEIIIRAIIDLFINNLFLIIIIIIILVLYFMFR